VRLDVIDDPGRQHVEALRPLFDAVRARTDHEPLGEHKVLDLVHGGPDCFRGIVARDDGRIVGYGHLSRHSDRRFGLEVVATRDEVRATIARRALEVLAADGGGHLHLWVFRPTEADDALATELGLTHRRDLIHMRVPLPVELKAAAPEGVVLRHFVPGQDEDAWLDVNNRTFAEHPEQGAWDRTTLERRMAEPWFDPEAFVIAEDDEGIAGFCWTKINPRCGEIYVIGVDPRSRSVGLGKVLVLAGLEHIAGRGVRHGCLYVDASQRAAVDLYTKIGFREDHRDRAYAGDVRPA
jgi:mycothiol synthase